MSEWQDFQQYKKQAMKAARQLYYGQATINRIKEARSIGEIQRIMKSARQKSIYMKDNWERG